MSVGRAGSCCPVRWINDSALQRIRPPGGAGGVLVWRGAVKNGTAGAGASGGSVFVLRSVPG